jgi:hypothetical protein
LKAVTATVLEQNGYLQLHPGPFATMANFGAASGCGAAIAQMQTHVPAGLNGAGGFGIFVSAKQTNNPTAFGATGRLAVDAIQTGP